MERTDPNSLSLPSITFHIFNNLHFRVDNDRGKGIMMESFLFFHLHIIPNIRFSRNLWPSSLPCLSSHSFLLLSPIISIFEVGKVKGISLL